MHEENIPYISNGPTVQTTYSTIRTEHASM